MGKVFRFWGEAAFLVMAVSSFFTGCSDFEALEGTVKNDGFENGFESEDFSVFSTVKIGEVEYDVLYNPFLNSGNSRSVENDFKMPEPTKEESENLTKRYENDKVLRRVLREELGIDVKDYIVMFNKTEQKSKSAQGIASLKDQYVLLNENKEHCATFQFKFVSSSMFPELEGTDSKTKRFMAMSEDEIRLNYEPDYVTVENKRKLYEGDYSKMKWVETQYYRDFESDEKITDFTTRGKIRRSVGEGGVEKENGKCSIPTRKTEYFEKGFVSYALQDPKTNSSFTQAYKKSLESYGYISAAGDGKVGGSTNQDDFQSRVVLNGVFTKNSNGSDRIRPFLRFTIEVKKNESQFKTKVQYQVDFYYKDGTLSVKKRINDETDFDGNAIFSALDEIETFGQFYEIVDRNVFEEGVSFKDCIKIKDWEEGRFPKSIILTAPFLDRNSVLQKYSKVTFSLSETVKDASGNFLYVPDIDSFLYVYKADYLELYRFPNTVIP